MAEQLAPTIIPRLGVTGLAAVPQGKLASQHDFLRMLFHHQHYDMLGFQGIQSICCKVDSKSKKAKCKEVCDVSEPWSESRAGCIESGSPCLLAKLKKNWDDANFPVKDCDSSILRVLGKIKGDFDKKKRRPLSAGEVESLMRTTVNLAPADWENRIRSDRLTSAAQHVLKINTMKDYLDAEGTRY